MSIGLTTAIAKLAVNGSVVLAMVQAWTPFTAWSWNFPAWSVSVEAFFLSAFSHRGSAGGPPQCFLSTRCGCRALAPCSCSPFLLWRLSGIAGAPSVGDHLQMAVEFTPLLRLPEFLLRILLGQAFLRGEFPKAQWKPGSVGVGYRPFRPFELCPSLPHPLLANGLLAPLFALLIVGLAKETASSLD